MKSPFKFLDSYTKEDRAIFFGRDREIEELYQRVFESKIMLVYGVSGTGKSSLIHCGLANKFRDTDWLPIVIRRGSNIIDSLGAGIYYAALTEKFHRLTTPADFRKAVKSLYLDHYKPVFFIFDQFEELFIFGTKEERRAFIQIVKLLTESELQCRMIFVMREEYMAGVTEFEKYIPTFFSNRVRIEKMSHSNAIEAIENPCKVAGINLEEGFAEALLERLSPEGQDVELTYLQVYLDKLFRNAEQEKSENAIPAFDMSILERAGNVSDLLGSFLEEQISLSESPEKALMILKSFVSVRGTKRQLNPAEIIEYTKTFGKDISENELSGILQSFVQLRILRERDQNGKFELRHDALSFKIFEKITLFEKGLIEVLNFLDNALISFQNRKILLSQNDLLYIAPFEDRLYFNKDISELLNRSKQEQNKIQRRIKNVAAAGFFSTIVFAAGAIMLTFKLPFSGSVRWLGLLVYMLWFLPVFSYFIIKNKGGRTINVLFLFFTVLFVVNSFLYGTSLRKELARPINFAYIKYENAVSKAGMDNDSLYNLIDKSITKSPRFPDNLGSVGRYRDFAYGFKIRSLEIDNYIRGLKLELIKTTEGNMTRAIEDQNIKFEYIRRIDDSNVPGVILFGASGYGKAQDLKMILNEYMEYLMSIAEDDPLLKYTISGSLSTEDMVEIDKRTSWEDYNFNGQSLGFVLLNLTKIQLDIKLAESRILIYVLERLKKD